MSKKQDKTDGHSNDYLSMSVSTSEVDTIRSTDCFSFSASTFPANNIPLALLPKAMSIAMTTLASTTNLIQEYAPGCSFLKRSCMDLLIFRPSSRASFSVSLDLAAITFKILNWETFSWMACRATSDQLISRDCSISCFRSSVTANVMVGMGVSSLNTVKAVYTLDLYKPFAPAG